MRLQLAVQFVKNDPRLDKTPPAFDIKFENPIHMLAGIDDQRVVDRLPTLRCAAAARQNGIREALKKAEEAYNKELREPVDAVRDWFYHTAEKAVL